MLSNFRFLPLTSKPARNTLIIYFISNILICSSVSFSQNSNRQQHIQFEHISNADGLSQNAVQCILQDSKGFMWFGTLNGLNKYDGYDFNVFQHNPNDTNSISNNEINSIYEDHEGTVWIGTSNGLNKFDRKTEYFIHYRHEPDNPNSLSNSKVMSISEDGNGILWIATQGGGLNTYDPHTNRFVHYTHNPGDTESIIHNYLSRVYVDRSDVIWIGTGQGLDKYDPKTNKFTHFRQNPASQNSLSDNDVWAIYESSSGALWVGTMGGLNKLNTKTGQITRYIHNPDLPESLGHNTVWAISEDTSGLLWIGTQTGLDKFDPDTETFTHYRPDPARPNSLSDEAVISIYEDQSEVLWIGTWFGGLNTFHPQREQFRQYKLNPHNPNSLSHNTVGSVFKDKSGILWIGTLGNGLNKYDREKEQYTHYLHDPLNPKSVSHQDVYSIYEDGSGTLWIGTRRGLDKFNRNTRQFERYTHDPQNPNSIGKGIITSMVEDLSGDLWIATWQDGLHKFDRYLERFTHIRHDPQNPNSLCYNMIAAVFADFSGELWIGTDNGLDKFNPETGQFTHFTHNPENHNSLSYDQINTICEDKAGNIWVGTTIGLNKYDRQDGQFIRYTVKDGLPNNSIKKVLCDNQNNIWISTDKGISRFNPETNKFKNFGLKDGIHVVEYSDAGYYKDGEMLFGGINGLISFYPERIKDNPYQPPVVISDFQLLSRWDATDQQENSRNKQGNLFSEEEQIELSHKDNVFSFEFAALDYRAPGKNQYKYMMEGFDKEWVHSGTRRFVNYTNLDPGEYFFKVMGSNNDGVWNENGASVKIIIRPPWWETTWAYLFFVLAGLALIYAGFRFRLNRERLKHDLKIEKIESEKLKELDNLKSRFFANISHEFRTPLTLILNPVQKLLIGDFQGKRKSYYELILKNAQRLFQLVNQLLDLSRLESGKLDLQVRPANIIAILRGIFFSFESLAQSKQIALQFDSDTDELILYFDPDKMEKILTNLFSNAFKFTPQGGEIKVTAAQKRADFLSSESTAIKSDFLEVKIFNSGDGIPAEHLPYIFDRFYQAGSSYKSDDQGSGIGPALTKELVTLHHGEIKVVSELEKGTEFILRLPLGKDFFKPEEVVEDELDSNIDRIESLTQPIPQPETEEKFLPAGESTPKSQQSVL